MGWLFVMLIAVIVVLATVISLTALAMAVKDDTSEERHG